MSVIDFVFRCNSFLKLICDFLEKENLIVNFGIVATIANYKTGLSLPLAYG